MFYSLYLLAFAASDDHWIWASLGAVFGLVLFRRGFRLLQRKRLIQNTPASKVRSASMGLVEISGHATGPYTLTAPMSQAPCYYYRTQVRQLKNINTSTKWELVADECLHVPFFLDDKTGRVLVDPHGAEMDLNCEFKEEYRSSLPAHVATFLRRYHLDCSRPTQVEEFSIQPQFPLFVLGTLTENPGIEVTPAAMPDSPTGPGIFRIDLSGGSQSAGLARLVENLPGARTTVLTTVTTTGQETGSAPVMRSKTFVNPMAPGVSPESLVEALKKAGINNPAAWEAAGLSAPDSVVPQAKTAPNAGEFDLHPKTVLMKGTANPLFMISFHSQRAVVGILGFKSAALIWGGPALTLFCSYYVLAHFGLL